MIVELSKEEMELVLVWFGDCSYITLAGNPCKNCSEGRKATCSKLIQTMKTFIEKSKMFEIGYKVI